MSRSDVEQLIDELLGWPWVSWDDAMSLLLDRALLEEETSA